MAGGLWSVFRIALVAGACAARAVPVAQATPLATCLAVRSVALAGSASCPAGVARPVSSS
jgi:hypothetical protein